ncbi:MAG: glycosyltransferase [Oscillospiraceae bacterium]|jgi:glycosyltransferase involved in cell wall biosynthesis|nr:glycosyltransferase [Oscillospiraceae bacterium]
MPKVTVIVPVYNKREYIPAMMESVLEQELSDIEIIVINDGSTDSSLPLIEKYARIDSRIRMYSQENAGLSVTRNVGMELAQGEYISFLDADDMLEKQALKCLYNKAVEQDLDMVYMQFSLLNLAGEKLKDMEDRRKAYCTNKVACEEMVTGPEMLRMLVEGNSYQCPVTCALYKHEFLRRNNLHFIPGILHEDNAFTFMCLLQAERVAQLREKLCVRTLVENSIITSRPSAQHLRGLCISLDAMIHFCTGRSFNERTERAIRSVLFSVERQIKNLVQTIDDTELAKLLTDRDLAKRTLYSQYIFATIKPNPFDAAVDYGQVKVSVIVPVYNAEQYLHDCMDSILTQTLQNIEVICVDDGSTDHSKKILEDYASRDDRVRILHLKHIFAGEARNRGIEVARGDYLCFVDADDFIDPNALMIAYTTARQNDSDLVLFVEDKFYTQTHSFTAASGSLRLDMLPPDPVFSSKTWSDKIFNITAPNIHNKFCSRALVQKYHIRFAPFRHSEDILFAFLVLALADRVSITDREKPFYHYRSDVPANLEHNRQGSSGLFIDTLKITKDSLVSHGVYKRLEKSFMNAAIILCAYNLNGCKAQMDQDTILSRFNDGFLKGYGAAGFPGAWLLSDAERNAYAQIVTQSRKPWLSSIPLRNSAPQDEAEQCVNALQKEPAISVVLPVYNVARFLPECIDSLQRQDFADFEMIFVDDASTDYSTEIIARYAEQDARIRLLRQEHQSAGAARNNGMQYARGKYLLFLDPDDFYEPAMLGLAFQQAEARRSDICMFRFAVYDNEKKKAAEQRWAVKTEDLPGNDPFSAREISDYVFIFWTAAPWNKLFLRNFIEQNQIEFQNLTNFNDQYFVRMAFACAERITILDECLLNHRTKVKSSLQSQLHKDPLCFYRALEKIHDELEKRGLLETFHASYEDLVISLVHHALRQTVKHYDAFNSIFDRMLDDGFERLSVCLHANEPRKYKKDEWNRICQMRTMPCADFYLLMQEHVPKESLPLADNLAWQIRKIRRRPLTQQDLDNAWRDGERYATNKIIASKSYQLGRMITFVPRKIRGFGCAVRKDGMETAIRKTGKKLAQIPSLFYRFVSRSIG